MLIRPAADTDADNVTAILEPVIRGGETYALDRDMSVEAMRRYWLGADRETFVAEDAGRLLGTYYIRPNQAGGGAHVCNCGYMTAPEAAGRGVGQLMARHSLEHARLRGYRAMQFNCVVSTNAVAVRLWQRMGFAVVGTLPGAFRHPSLGYVDALVMYQTL